ncbi:hypothetical protein D9757_001623 [Collybiopsis confluens]|uniref:Uncharacterized protein n=1 Tax=Collybiopsis confluens TaxID=2823264 RepID=A0A8H5HYF0_9AGAR|nr:hypothetical protein D9757_001623 [Collybiopsis confluens]
MPAIMVPQVTTTTVFPSASATSSVSRSSGSKVPVAAIAGGTSAGALLAIALVIFWTVWGRSIKRAKAKQQKEADKLRITKQNTLKNATAFSKPRSYSYKPLFQWSPSEATRVKFLAPDGSIASPRKTTPSHPKPLVPARGSHITSAPTLQPLPPAQLATTDYDYAESAEGNSQIYALVAALRSGSHRLSSASSWSRFSKSTGNRGSDARFSQATSGSSYSQASVNRSTNSVGLAY